MDFLLIRFVMIDFRMKVELIFFEISNESILLIDKLIESFNLLSKHNDFMFEIFNFNFNVSVFIKSLLKIVDFGLVWLNFIVVISQKIVQSFNFFIKWLIISVNFNVSSLLFFEWGKFLLKFRDHKFELFIVFNLRVELFLESFFVFLYVGILIEFCLKLCVTVFPFFDFSKSTF